MNRIKLGMDELLTFNGSPFLRFRRCNQGLRAPLLLDNTATASFKQGNQLADITKLAHIQQQNISTEAITLLDLLGERPIVLVGMMGAGKTTVGRRLATRLNRKFVDSDAEIEKAAGMSIEDMFALRGEAEFRTGETKVIARLLNSPNIVLGTGGGAFISDETRALVKSEALSVWLKAEIDVLFDRVSRRSNRPLLKTANPRETLQKLIDARYPLYAEVDVTVISRDVPHDVIAGEIVTNALAHMRADAPKA